MIQITQSPAKHTHRISFREHGKTCMRVLLFSILLLPTAVLADELYLKNGLLYRNVQVMDTTGTMVSILRDSIMVSLRIELIEKIEMKEYIPNQKSTREIYSQSKYDEFTQSQTQDPVRQKNGIQMTITTPGGEQLVGTLLYASDSLLVLWQSTDPYDLRNLKSSGKTVYFSEIEHIVIKREGQFWSSLGYGALIGSGIGGGMGAIYEVSANTWGPPVIGVLLGSIVFGVPGALIGGIIGAIQDSNNDLCVRGDYKRYRAIVPALKKEAIFPLFPPPELQIFVNQSRLVN